MAAPTDFTELLLRHGTQLADQTAFWFLSERRSGLRAAPLAGPEGLESDTITYGELDQYAKGIAARLQQCDPVGRRAVVLHRDGPGFIGSFLGCLYAGAIPVPAPGPGGSRQNSERLVGIVKDTAAAFVLADEETAPEVSRLLAGSGRTEALCLAADHPRLADPADWRRPETAPGSPAYLQYTSGSVSDPKGVAVGHDNLLANQRMIQQALGTHRRSRIGGWLPSHHDMGLIGQLLHPLYLGATGVLLPALTFVRRPVRWLQAIDRYGITVTGAPHFAFELCLRSVTDEQLAGLDLSRLETMVDGAEPVDPASLDAFAERFARAGLRPEALRPAYGLAEATLLVAAAAGHRAPRYRLDPAAPVGNRAEPAAPGGSARTLASVGSVPEGTRLRIVDPANRQPLPAGDVGEIWVRGPAVAQGYWSRPRDTADTFQALLAGTGEGDEGHGEHWLRTGDLGFLGEDGELRVTGRLKDMLIVFGRNLYPQDIEGTVQKLSVLFGSSTAFTVEADREHVVLVQEVRTGGGFDAELPALAAAVQRCVTEEFEVAAENVLLVRPGTVRRTTSGKLRRAAMRQLFLAGRIEPLHEVIAPEVRALVLK